jgi:peptide/nickel transport system permease protein
MTTAMPPVEARLTEGRDQPEARDPRGPWALAGHRLLHDRTAMVSAAFIVLLVLAAVFAPLIADLTGHNPDTQDLIHGLSPKGLPHGPDSTYWFGTDSLGRDIFIRIIYGARVSLLVGIVSSLSAVIVGTTVGMVAGYFGGFVDTALSRLMDLVLSFPFLLAAIALVSVVGPSLSVIIIVIAFFSWASVGRIVRGLTLSIREKEYIEAARASGAGPARIMTLEILPNLTAPLIVYTTLLIPAAIAFEATLSFLGLGIVPPTPSWGDMLADAIKFYEVAWWYIAFPGAALLLTTLAFNLLGDSLRDALDPRGERLLRSLTKRSRPRRRWRA